ESCSCGRGVAAGPGNSCCVLRPFTADAPIIFGIEAVRLLLEVAAHSMLNPCDLMKTHSPSVSPVTRRTFLKTGAILTAGVASLSLPARAQTNKNGKLRIFQVGVGGIGSLQRGGLKGHPNVEWAGFCDVDQRELDRIKKEHPESWTVRDYREAFANKVGDFDAVIVDVPDFHHAPVMLNALKHNKHIYGQKPLVHQLEELRMIRDGLKARPSLVTQMGNQRACNRGRMVSVELLRKNQLGRPVEAWVWTGGVSRGHYFADAWSSYKSQ